MVTAQAQLGPIYLGPSRTENLLVSGLYLGLTGLLLYLVQPLPWWGWLSGIALLGAMWFEQFRANRDRHWRTLQLNQLGSVRLARQPYQLRYIQGYSRYLMVWHLVSTETPTRHRRLVIWHDGVYPEPTSAPAAQLYRTLVSLSVLAVKKA